MKLSLPSIGAVALALPRLVAADIICDSGSVTADIRPGFTPSKTNHTASIEAEPAICYLEEDESVDIEVGVQLKGEGEGSCRPIFDTPEGIPEGRASGNVTITKGGNPTIIYVAGEFAINSGDGIAFFGMAEDGPYKGQTIKLYSKFDFSQGECVQSGSSMIFATITMFAVSS
jgi:hypothetical protein